jgi:anti-sigma factor RsiW
MNCDHARPLIPSYLDGELSEAQAAPLRKHLLDCQACRGGAQSDKNLKRWFVADEPVAVPRDFAARVARRAFAGDRGVLESPLVVAASDAPDREGRVLQFVLRLTAVAAAVLFVVALAIRQSSLPPGESLQADIRDASATNEQILQRLDGLNQNDANAADAAAGANGTPTGGPVRTDARK